MGLARGTVRKFADAVSFPERAVRPPGPSILDRYLDHLEARLAAGCENTMALWRDLQERGFSGTARQVHRTARLGSWVLISEIWYDEESGDQFHDRLRITSPGHAPDGTLGNRLHGMRPKGNDAGTTRTSRAGINDAVQPCCPGLLG
jgi:hypothetical protein